MPPAMAGEAAVMGAESWPTLEETRQKVAVEAAVKPVAGNAGGSDPARGAPVQQVPPPPPPSGRAVERKSQKCYWEEHSKDLTIESKMLDSRAADLDKEERPEVPAFETKHALAPCMVAPTKIIAGLGLSLGIDILEAPGATGDYRTLLTSKAKAIAKALSAPLDTPPSVFVPGEDGYKAGRENGYDFGFLHIKAIDDAGHDKAVKLKVRGLEAVDRAVGQLARLLWEAEKSGHYQYFLCVTGDHSTPVEYGDHSFEPVPFALCRLRDFVGAIGDDNVMNTPLDDFPLPSVKSGEDLAENIEVPKRRSDQRKAFSGDSVCEFNEIAAARGCLGRFPGSEMMGIIKKFIKAKND